MEISVKKNKNTCKPFEPHIPPSLTQWLGPIILQYVPPNFQMLNAVCPELLCYLCSGAYLRLLLLAFTFNFNKLLFIKVL